MAHQLSCTRYVLRLACVCTKATVTVGTKATVTIGTKATVTVGTKATVIIVAKAIPRLHTVHGG